MRKFLIPIAAAASMIAVATPAAAQQWAPPVYHNSPYNYGYGYNGFNFARTMESRVQRIRGDIRNLEMRRVLSRNEARRLDNQAERLQRRIYRATRGGIQAHEARSVENQIRNLEIRISRESNDWNNRYGNRHYRRY
jgi:hypothetical protein